MNYGTLPPKRGLYDPANEHDACGVGFVCNIKGIKRHAIVRQGLQILENLTHRGAVGADPLAGDGAGILLQIPHGFLREECAAAGIELPDEGDYGVGMVFLPQQTQSRARCEAVIAEFVAAEGQALLGWRDVPTDNSCLGQSVLPLEPVVRQVFIGRGSDCADVDSFERKLFVIRKQAENAVAREVCRIVRAFLTEEEVPNVVNVCRNTPARYSVVLRMLDKVGALPSVV